MAPTHPKTFNSKRNASSLKQVTLSFKSTKRGAAASLKSKAKSKPTFRAKSETEAEVDDDSQILADSIGSGDQETSSMKRETLDMRDKSGKYKEYYRVVKEKMGWMPPCQYHSHGNDVLFTLNN